MTITMYDGTASDLPGIPKNAQAVASYVDNRGGANELASRFPNAQHLSITVVSPGADADCIDIEPRGCTIADAVPWFHRQVARGASAPCFYSDQNDAPAIKAALGAAGIQRNQYRYWIADPTGSGHMLAGYDATQWAFGSGFDTSWCVDGFFSGAGGGAGTGGIAGLGGTGTVVNGAPASTYQFQIGGTSNPDEDVWTGVNRLAQEVNWYLFSNGESLYYLDGQEMIAQTPALLLDRIADADRLYLDGTWDNTAYGFVSAHKRKFSVQRKTSVTTVTSPTQATVQLICGIDEIRAGDVIQLQSFGPLDGRWIVGSRRRSVFSTTSELTLVPPMSPMSELAAAGTTGKRQTIISSTTSTTATTGSRATGGAVTLKGGATNPAPGATWGRLDMGFDGDYGPAGLVAPYNGTIHGSWSPGVNTGWPGNGTQGAGPYFAILNDDQTGPDYTRAMYFAEGAAPIVSSGTHVTAGQKIGNPISQGGTGAPGNFEIGPANTSNFDTLAKTYGLGSSGARQMVLAFYAWMQTLGAGTSTNTSSAGAP